jgi:hypothetical protein
MEVSFGCVLPEKFSNFFAEIDFVIGSYYYFYCMMLGFQKFPDFCTYK